MKKNIYILSFVFAALLAAKIVISNDPTLVAAQVSQPEPMVAVVQDIPIPASGYDYASQCPKKAPKHFNTMVNSAAIEFGVDPKALTTLVVLESGCNEKALGSSGDTGLGQIIPSVWSKTLKKQGIKKSLWDPQENLRATAFILSSLIEKYGKAAIGKYNGSGKKATIYAAKYATSYKKMWLENFRISASKSR